MSGKKKKIGQGIAVASLLLNVLILPGLGSIIGGRTKKGIYQIVLTIIGIPLLFLFGLGAILIIGAWIWGLVTGIKIVKESDR